MKKIKSKYSIVSIQIVACILLALVAVSCGGKKANAELGEEEEEHAHHEEGGSAVEINAAQYRQLNIQMGDVEMKNRSFTVICSKSSDYKVQTWSFNTIGLSEPLRIRKDIELKKVRR